MRFVASIALLSLGCAAAPPPEVAPATVTIEPTPAASAGPADEPPEAAPAVRIEEAPDTSRALDRATADHKQRARAFMVEGMQLLSAGDAAAALPRFHSAYQLVPAPTVAIYMGRALAQLGRREEARRLLLRVAAEKTRPADPPAYRMARQRAAAEAASLGP